MSINYLQSAGGKPVDNLQVFRDNKKIALL